MKYSLEGKKIMLIQFYRKWRKKEIEGGQRKRYEN